MNKNLFIFDRRGMNLDSQSMRIYLNDVRRRHLLTQEREQALSQQVRQGGEKRRQAVAALTEGNLRFGISMAKHFLYNGLDVADLIQEASIGMMTAAGNYDDGSRAHFPCFAVGYVKDALMKAVREKGRLYVVPLSVSREKDGDGDRHRHLSLDAPAGNDGITTFADLLAAGTSSDGTLATRERRRRLKTLLDYVVGQRNSDLLWDYYGFNPEIVSMGMVKERYGLTTTSLSSARLRALDMIRHSGYLKKITALLTV